MIPLRDALSRVLEGCPPLEPERVPTMSALGCVLAEPGVARLAVPPFANSAMDGYAVRADDVAGAPATLEVVGTILAGSTADVLVGPGQAARIMTGAPVPAGADAVCMVEHTRPAGGLSSDGHGTQVVIETAVARGEHVRPVGDDVGVGDVVLPAGATVGPTQLAALLSAGCVELLVHPRPRVGVLSTGDELVDPGEPLGRGQIYDSNRPMLRSLLADAGCEAVDLGHAPDEEGAIAGTIEKGLADLDAIVLSGGVSVGDVDLVRVVLEKLATGGAEWMQIAIRPAKPFAFARLPKPPRTGRTSAGGAGGERFVPAFGLPGNPVSAAVGFELLVRPALLAMSGFRRLHRPVVTARAGDSFGRRQDGKLHLVRVRLDRGDDVGPGAGSGWVARRCPGQGSHQIRSMALADGLAFVPDGEGVAEGEQLEVLVTDPAVLGEATAWVQRQ